MPVVGQTSYTAGVTYSPYAASRPASLIRKGSGYWNEDEEDEPTTPVVPQDPSGDPVGYIDTPLGDTPYVLFLLLMAFYLLKKTKTKIHFFNHKNL